MPPYKIDVSTLSEEHVRLETERMNNVIRQLHGIISGYGPATKRMEKILEGLQDPNVTHINVLRSRLLELYDERAYYARLQVRQHYDKELRKDQHGEELKKREQQLQAMATINKRLAEEYNTTATAFPELMLQVTWAVELKQELSRLVVEGRNIQSHEHFEHVVHHHQDLRVRLQRRIEIWIRQLREGELQEGYGQRAQSHVEASGSRTGQRYGDIDPNVDIYGDGDDYQRATPGPPAGYYPAAQTPSAGEGGGSQYEQRQGSPQDEETHAAGPSQQVYQQSPESYRYETPAAQVFTVPQTPSPGPNYELPDEYSIMGYGAAEPGFDESTSSPSASSQPISQQSPSSRSRGSRAPSVQSVYGQSVASRSEVYQTPRFSVPSTPSPFNIPHTTDDSPSELPCMRGGFYYAYDESCPTCSAAGRACRPQYQST